MLEFVLLDFYIQYGSQAKVYQEGNSEQKNNIEKVEFLPYHKLGDEKYTKLGILNPYQDKEAMDTVLCENLYQEFEAIYYERNQRD